MKFYSRKQDEWNPHKLPDAEVFELTASEAAEHEEELIWEYKRRPEFQLAAMNSATRERMLDAIVEREGIKGGWFYHYCFPGCLPESSPMGPYESAQEAMDACRAEMQEE